MMYSFALPQKNIESLSSAFQNAEPSSSSCPGECPNHSDGASPSPS